MQKEESGPRCGKGLLGPRSFEQPPGQVMLPAYGPPHHDVATDETLNRPPSGRSCFGSRVTLPCPLPNPVKVCFGEPYGRLIGRLQEPGFKLRSEEHTSE